MRDEASSDQITLNFLRLRDQPLRFTVHRRRHVSHEQNESSESFIWIGMMPSVQHQDEGKYEQFDVKIEAFEGSAAYSFDSSSAVNLSKAIAFERIVANCEKNLGSGKFHVLRGYRRRVRLVLTHDEYGEQVLWLEPYFLKRMRSLGFLIGFEFVCSPDKRHDREVLRRSLSLDSQYRENRDFYADYLAKLGEFAERFREALFPGTTEGVPFAVDWPPVSLEPDKLSKKQYQFGGQQVSASQFMGVKSHGPLKILESKPVLCFLYQEEKKPFAHDLYFALAGKTFPAVFPGMNQMFSMEVGRQSTEGVVIDSFDADHVADRIQAVKERRPDDDLLPIILFPWSRHRATPESDKAYYSIKHRLLQLGLSSQFVSIDQLQDRETLKWATSNIGLAVFSKLGGIPWKLRPEQGGCLIIGIGQAHRKDATGHIHRHYAYSVLTDSSGVYQRIRVLSESSDEQQYLNGLTGKLSELIEEFSDKYSMVAIHATFALRKKEMQAIEESAGSSREDWPRVVVLNFDDRSKYMGFAMWNNSRVPFESTVVELSPYEYIVWFEGLQYGKNALLRRVGRPMYIKFGYGSAGLDRDAKRRFLQDAVNLSGANWRGFNAKTMPVSVYYAKLIAKYIGNFDKLGLETISIDDVHPWFL